MKHKLGVKERLKAMAVKKPGLIHDSREYRIDKIPLNYRIHIKLPHTPTAARNGIGRDRYHYPDAPISEVHEHANKVIDEYFVR